MSQPIILSRRRLLQVGSLAAALTAIDLTTGRAHADTNTYPPCQCTWWAKNERPDLPNYLGDAQYWPAHARAAGFPTGSTPVVGAIVAFQPWVQGAYGSGHVAYVDAVYSPTSYHVSEMNFGGPACTVTYRTAYTGTGVEFIYYKGQNPGGSSGASQVITDETSGDFSKGGDYWVDTGIGYNGHAYWTYVNGNSVDCWGEWRANLVGGN